MTDMEEKKHPINDLLATTMEKIRMAVDSNNIIGEPIHAEGVTLIPVSRLSFGFATGGSDFATKKQKTADDKAFGGGSGAGVKLEPTAFLIVKGDNVRLLPVGPGPETTADRIVDMVPDLFDKVTALIDKKGKKEEVVTTDDLAD